MKDYNINKKYRKGFTIVEMVIVIAIFLFVISGAISIFISVITHQRQILAEEQLLNQVSYALEYMSKGLRMAKPELNYGCMVYTEPDGNQPEPDASNGGFIYLLTRYDEDYIYNGTSGAFRGVKFLNQSDADENGPLCQEFFVEPLNGEAPESETNPSVIKEKRGSADSVPITSPSFSVNYMKISINGMDGRPGTCPELPPKACGASDEDVEQPKITLLLNISVPGDNQPSRTFQTTISQRNLNVK